METDQYNLRWHYHHSETFLAFESLRRSESFVDVVLSCEKRSIFAHKLVLSACSNYFFDVLRSVREGQMPVLFFRDTAMDLLEYVIHYIYHGEVEIPSARITDFINLAEALEIKGLKREDGFTADGSGSSNPVASAASASYIPKRKYDVYGDPNCHPLAGPVPSSVTQDEPGYDPDPKRLRESNFSPTYVPSRRSLSVSHHPIKDPHEQHVKSEFWPERPAENYSESSPGASSSQPVPKFSPKEDSDGRRPSQMPPEISPAAPITQVAQVIWRGTDLNNRVLYFCEVCLYKTTKNSNAFAHERRHTQEKPFVCACGKAYKAPHPLRVHRQSCPVGGGGTDSGGGPSAGGSGSDTPENPCASPGDSPPPNPPHAASLDMPPQPPPPPPPPPQPHMHPHQHPHPVQHSDNHHHLHPQLQHHSMFDHERDQRQPEAQNYSQDRGPPEVHPVSLASNYGSSGILDLKENLR